jgi:adenylate kinase
MKSTRLSEYGSLMYELAEKFVAVEKENKLLKKEVERLQNTIKSISDQKKLRDKNMKL